MYTVSNGAHGWFLAAKISPVPYSRVYHKHNQRILCSMVPLLFSADTKTKLKHDHKFSKHKIYCPKPYASVDLDYSLCLLTKDLQNASIRCASWGLQGIVIVFLTVSLHIMTLFLSGFYWLWKMTLTRTTQKTQSYKTSHIYAYILTSICITGLLT